MRLLRLREGETAQTIWGGPRRLTWGFELVSRAARDTILILSVDRYREGAVAIQLLRCVINETRRKRLVSGERLYWDPEALALPSPATKAAQFYEEKALLRLARPDPNGSLRVVAARNKIAVAWPGRRSA